MRAVLLTILFALYGAGFASAQDGDRLAAMRSAYADWTVRNDTTGTGAIASAGQPAMAMGNAAAPIELASVSKSITALCAAALHDAGQLDFADNVRALLGRGPDVTVASLITHTSGITADITQPLMGLWLGGTEHRAAMVLDLMAPPRGAPGDYVYNNVNYALLALVIEAAADAPYEQTCRTLVLDPVGVRGQPSPRSGAFLSWGGWAMSPFDFAQLHGHWFGQAAATGRDPFAYPHVAIGDAGVFYGLGTVFRASGLDDGRFNFWHFGALCFPNGFNVGAYAVTWGGRWTAVLGYDACVDTAAMAALDGAMGRAARGPFQ